MNTINFKLKGLTCEACVKLSTSRIKKIPEVQDVKIDFKSGNAEVTSTADIDLDTIRRSLVGTNYNVTN
jgi:copper chaperone CopZ